MLSVVLAKKQPYVDSIGGLVCKSAGPQKPTRCNNVPTKRYTLVQIFRHMFTTVHTDFRSLVVQALQNFPPVLEDEAYVTGRIACIVIAQIPHMPRGYPVQSHICWRTSVAYMHAYKHMCNVQYAFELLMLIVDTKHAPTERSIIERALIGAICFTKLSRGLSTYVTCRLCRQAFG